MQPLQGLSHLLVIEFLLFTSVAVSSAGQKYLCAAAGAPKAGNCSLQILETQPDTHPNRSFGLLEYNTHSHPFCTCSSTSRAPIIGDRRGFVKGNIKQMFVFVYLHKYKTLFLLRFYNKYKIPVAYATGI